MEKVNVGIVGISNHGVTIRNSTLKSQNFNIVSCFDINDEASKEFSQITKCKIEDLDSMVNNPSIDAIILVTPNFLHLEQGLKVLRSKKHLFLEKPITNISKEAIELIREAKAQGMIMQIGHNRRMKPNYRAAKKIIDSKKLGDIVAFYANYSHDGGFNPNMPKWKADESKCPLLPMMQLGVHFIDTIQYLLDDVKNVSCFANNFAMENGVLDSVTANIQLKNGIIGNLQSHYVIPAIFEYKVFGTKGWITVSECYCELTTMENNKYIVDKQVFSEANLNSYDIEMQEFADCVIQKKEPEVGGLDGTKALAVIEAMSLSVKEKRVVEIEEIFSEKML